MAIGVPSQRTAGTSDTDATSYATASISPASSVLMVVGLLNSRGSAPTAPGIATTGLNLGAFTAIGTVVTPNDIARISAWWCDTGGSPGTGTIDFSFSGATQTGAQWVVWEISGANLSSPIVRSATNNASATTSCTVTLTNDTWAVTGSFHGITGTDVVTQGSGFSALGNQSGSAPARRLRGQYLVGIDVTAEMTTAGNVDWGAVGFGIAEAATGGFSVDSVTGARRIGWRRHRCAAW